MKSDGHESSNRRFERLVLYNVSASPIPIYRYEGIWSSELTQITGRYKQSRWHIVLLINSSRNIFQDRLRGSREFTES